ncbi:MAG: LysM peptidoglycan-binding domain-containing protein [Chloroflexota bacterium]
MKEKRKRIQIIMQIGVLLIWLLAGQAHLAKDRSSAKAAPLNVASRSELILAMNTLRVSNGLPALIEDPIVNAVAQSTAEIMAANNMSWHIGDVRGRLAAAGYGGGATVWATENFAVGNMSIDQVMQVWSDADHMRPAVTPAYCHVGAGVAPAGNGRYYFILQAAYISGQACGSYVPGTGNGTAAVLPVSQLIIPVKVATPDAEGRIYHIVQAGQSFWAIAIAYHVTIHDLEVWNNLSSEYSLAVGQKLFIPTSGTAGYATPTPSGMVLVAAPDAQGKIVHEVQPYQALIPISQAYNVSVDRILALNGLQADWPLQIGQKLLIDPGKTTPLSALARLTPDSDGNYYHIVQSGEYLAWIADLYDVSLAELMAWNGLTSASIIRPGQRLLLRVTPPATFTPVPPSATPTSRPIPASATPPLELATPTAAHEAETQSSFPKIVAVLVVVLVLIGVLLLGWTAWRKRQADG